MKREMKRSSLASEEEREREVKTLATIILATIYNIAHRGKTASVRTSVTEGQPDTKRVLCFECLAPD